MKSFAAIVMAASAVSAGTQTLDKYVFPSIAQRALLTRAFSLPCARDGDCRTHGDLAATCDVRTGLGNGCQCTGNYQGSLCAPRTQQLRVHLKFSRNNGTVLDCSTKNTYYTEQVKETIVAGLQEFAGEPVQDIAFVCGKDKQPHVAAHFNFPTVDIGRWQKQHDDDKISTAQAKVLRSKILSVDNAVILGDVITGYIRTNTDNDGCTASQAAFRGADSGGAKVQICMALECPTGQYKRVGAVTDLSWGYTCAAIASARAEDVGTCLVDGDCKWDATKTVCRNRVCVLPQQNVLVRLPRLTSVTTKNYCLNDKDCQKWGDDKATCSFHTGLGNWCSCSFNYDYPAKNVPLCYPRENPLKTVRLVFLAQFNLPVSSLTVLQKQALERLVTKALGQVSGVYFLNPALSATTSFVGLVDVPAEIVSTAMDTASTTVLRNIVNTYLTNQLLVAPSRDASVLATDIELWRSLNGQFLNMFLLQGASNKCNLEYAATTFEQFPAPAANGCQAVTCTSEGVLSERLVGDQKNLFQTYCAKKPAAPLIQDPDRTLGTGGGMNKTHLVSIIVGSIVGLGLLLFLAAFLATASDEADAEPIDDEKDIEEEA